MISKKEDDFTNILELVAPGTTIREGLENILKSKTGGLIVVGDTKEILDIVDGGFYINVDYSPAKLYELAKMDGAIVLSSDLKKILYANTQLIPSSQIETKETGTRHKTAERVAKQTGKLVISISQRRSIITLYKENFKYVLEETRSILEKANQALQTVEKYKKVFESKINMLNEYEFNDIVTLDNVLTAIQRAEMTMRMSEEVRKRIIELGEEGRLVKIQLDELIGGLQKEEQLIIKDYIVPNRRKKLETVYQKIIELEYEELMDERKIANTLGYEDFDNYEEIAVYPRGYRILNKIPRVPNNIVENLVKSFKTFQHIIVADIKKLDEVEGIGEVRAKNIKQSIKRMQEQFVFDNVMI